MLLKYFFYKCDKNAEKIERTWCLERAEDVGRAVEGAGVAIR
jgi:hypothetical protein